MATGGRYRDQDLWMPTSFHREFVETNVLVDRNANTPFARQVDLWWYAVGLGVRANERTPLPMRSQLTRFNDGGILGADPWRITHLELLVLGEEGEEAAADPAKVLQTANEYAVTGFRILTEELRTVNDPQSHLVSLISQI